MPDEVHPHPTWNPTLKTRKKQKKKDTYAKKDGAELPSCRKLTACLQMTTN